MNKIAFISYEELVSENKKRKSFFDNDMLLKYRIQEIAFVKDTYGVKVFCVNLKQEKILYMTDFLKMYLNSKDIYISNITYEPFKSIFEYKSYSARLNAKGKKEGVKQSKKSDADIASLKQNIVSLEQNLTAIYNKKSQNRSEGITVLELTVQCLKALREGKGDKHILLSDMDELNELHTCWDGLEDLEGRGFSSDDCHDHNDISKCMIIL